MFAIVEKHLKVIIFTGKCILFCCLDISPFVFEGYFYNIWNEQKKSKQKCSQRMATFLHISSLNQHYRTSEESSVHGGWFRLVWLGFSARKSQS